MKRFFLLILAALLLSACTPKAYTESIEAGTVALQKGNYDGAVNHFEKALKEKETAEAKDYLHFSKVMQESLTLYHKGDLDAALYSLQKLLKEDFSKQADGKVIKQASSWIKKMEQTKTVSDSMKENIGKGRTLLEQGQYDQAYEVFKQVTETTNLADVATMEKMAKDASNLLMETTDKKNEKQKQAEEQKKKDDEKKQQEEDNKPLTPDQAVTLVKQYLNLQSGQNVKVVYDHDADNGDYIIHVYEFVVDNPSTGEGHTATLGWYGVNKQTKKVYDAMQ